MKRTIMAMLTVSTVLFAVGPALAQTIKLGTLAPGGLPLVQRLSRHRRGLEGCFRRHRPVPYLCRWHGGRRGQHARKMCIGQLHAAALSGAGLQEIVPEIQALQMPMMFCSNADLDYVREQLAPRFEALLAAKGLQVLHWGEAGWCISLRSSPWCVPQTSSP